MTTIKKLKEIINKLDDNIILVKHGDDHSYIYAYVNLGTALFNSDEITEDYCEEYTPEKEFGKRKEVLIIE